MVVSRVDVFLFWMPGRTEMIRGEYPASHPEEAGKQGNLMNAFCRSFPASCYSEIVSHLSNSSDYRDAFWVESALEASTTPKALKGGIFTVFCSVLRTFWRLFYRFQRLFVMPSKTHPTHNKWIR
jgi:hypothetical protein